MSGQHTPGPVGYASAEHLCRRAEYDRNGSVIYARPCGTYTTPVFAGPHAEAATELLEALEAMARYDDLDFYPPSISDVARAAIARARAQ